MAFELQPILENDRAILYPLREEDFDSLYSVASDPKIWEQHPNTDRWKIDVFRNFFDGALQSRGAFSIVDKASGKVVGSSRFYDYDGNESQIFIGYTFYARSHWGNGFNRSVKGLMLDHAFQFVSRVRFHIGERNHRSQIAIGRMGAVKTGEQVLPYFGEPPRLNFVYEINRDDWNLKLQP